jgi:hypothetical protein
VTIASIGTVKIDGGVTQITGCTDHAAGIGDLVVGGGGDGSFSGTIQTASKVVCSG